MVLKKCDFGGKKTYSPQSTRYSDLDNLFVGCYVDEFVVLRSLGIGDSVSCIVGGVCGCGWSLSLFIQFLCVCRALCACACMTMQILILTSRTLSCC